MHYLIKTGLFVAVIVAIMGVSSVKSHYADKYQTPETRVVTFYQWYLNTLNQDKDPFKEGKSTLKKFVTARLLTQIDRQRHSPSGLDADYFLQAQDWLDDWENSVTVLKPVTMRKNFSVTVTLGATTQTRHLIKVLMHQEKDVWKIDRVQPVQL